MRKLLVKAWTFTASLLLYMSVATAAVPPKLNAFKEGERVIYARLVQAYRSASLNDLDKQLKVLERNYPTSVHLDNAIYLKAMLQFQNGFIGEAVRGFNDVTDRFPKSNKRPAALFALGMSYKKLNLKEQANRVFKSVVREYPGSSEAQRAKMQLRM